MVTTILVVAGVGQHKPGVLNGLLLAALARACFSGIPSAMQAGGVAVFLH